MSDKPKPPYDAAARKAQLQERAADASDAMSQYKADRKAERAKTERLRALRLAKEVANKVAKQTQANKEAMEHNLTQTCDYQP